MFHPRSLRTPLLLVLVGCGPGPATVGDSGTPTGTIGDSDSDTVPVTDTDDTVSFAEDIAPLFASRCNDCHHPTSAIGYDFTNPFDPETGIVGRENSFVPNGSDETLVVDPGNPENSFLITKVSEEDLDVHVDGKTMPYQPELLSTEELAAVEQWILDGANDDAHFRDVVAPIFGTEITLGKASGRCTWCHYPGSPTGLNVLDVFDPVEGLVDAPSNFGGVRVVPGDPDASDLMTKLRNEGPGQQMPLHEDRLDEDEIQLLWDWIEQGALDN